MRHLLTVLLLFFSLWAHAQSSSLSLALEYFEREEYEKALAQLEPYLRDHQRSAYQMGLDSYLALEEYRSAERMVESYIRATGGNSYDYQVDLYMVYQAAGDEKDAESFLEDIRERVERSPGLSYGFANTFQKKGYPRLALDLYLIAEEKIPNANYAYQKALLYGELGDIENMYRNYVEMIHERPAYLSTVKQLLGRAMGGSNELAEQEFLKELLIRQIQNGGPPELNELLIFVFVKEKNFSGAFTQLRALDKRQGGPKGQIFKLGQVAMNNEEYLTARRIFSYVIKAGPDYPYYESALAWDLRAEKQRLLANSSTSREQWLALREDYQNTLDELSQSPEQASICIDLADLNAFQLGQGDTAIALLKDCINSPMTGPEDQARAKIKLADILLYEGNRWEAILYYKQAEKAYEQSPIGQEAKFKRAKAAYFVGDFQWAQGIFDALKSSTSKKIANDALYYSILITDNTALDTNMEAMAMYARADLMYYQGRLDSALEVLASMEIAFVDHGIQDELLWLKSRIYLQRNEFERAETVLRQIVDEHNKDILADDALYALARLYEDELKRPDEASTLYELIFTEHPDSFFASEARKRFRRLRGDILN